MEYVEIVSVFVLAYFSYKLGKGSADGNVLTLKRENERLNQKLQKHNVRDSRGRFTSNKTK
jgi:hypothetical protein